VDAIRQVATLAETYGSTYSSTDLIFGGEEEEPKINVKPGGGKRN
jgi:dTDP-4-dehydrorhamnose reductase